MMPRALRAGSRLAIVSPASAAVPEKVEAGVQHLQSLGYETVMFPHALDRGPLYYAGRLENRLRDLHAAFADDSIDGVLCTRGGWGAAELLPHLDAELIRAHPKCFIGYSDQTSLQSWMRNAGLRCFYGPMVASDFSRTGGVDLSSWSSALSGVEPWSVGVPEGLRVLRRGVAEGRLEGGCLSILAEGLGTPYALKAADGVLFLEDIGTKPYQWDRMLLHLRYAGMLEGVRGIVFGDMQQCVAPAEMELLEGAILHSLREFDGPIAMGLRCGHVHGANVTLPLGVEVRLECEDVANPMLHFLEAAVVAFPLLL